MYRSRFSPLILLAIGLTTALLFVGCDSAGPSGEEDPEQEESNEAPTAVAEASNTTVDVGTDVTLDASSSEDPDGDDLSFSWSLTTPSGSEAALSDASAEQPTFTADESGDYVASVEVSDGDESSSDEVTVTAEASTVEINSNVTSDRTLSPDQKYLVTSMIGIENGATLTIEPGVTIMFESDTGFSVNDNNSALVAAGTSSDPIQMVGTESSEDGWWQGIGVYSSNPNNELNYVQIEDAGSARWSSMSSAGSIGINNGGELTLTNSTIANGGNYGVHIDEPNIALSFSGNTFSSIQTAPLNIPFTLIGEVDSGSTFESGTFVRIWNANPSSGDITVDALSNDVPYRIAGTPGLDGDVTITISPGVEMEFTANSNITVNSDDAALIASGASDNMITMTGTQTDPEGWWQGIGVYSSNPNNELNYVQIEDAGSARWSSMSSAGSIGINNASELTLTNSTIANGGNYGLHIDEPNIALSFSGNTFSSIQTAPLNIPFTLIGEIDSGTTFESGTFVRIWNADPSSGDITVDALSNDVPYRIAGTPALDGTVTVTIDPGVEMEFTANANITVDSDNAALIANGESGNPILMTATPGNDSPGWWQGIAFYSNNPNNTLNYVTIEYGGSERWSSMSDAANVGLNTDAELSLTNSTITNSGQHGVYCDESDLENLSGSGNSFSNNAGQDVSGCTF